MKIQLFKASITDASLIHSMQVESFKSLLRKYEDFETNPGAESVEKIVQKMKQSYTDYFLIKLDMSIVGAIRIVKIEDNSVCRISPLFILPDFRNKGIAQIVFKLIEELYNPKNGWVLETILEEKGNCYLYEKLGYIQTGKIDKIKDGMNIVHYRKTV